MLQQHAVGILVPRHDVFDGSLAIRVLAALYGMGLAEVQHTVLHMNSFRTPTLSHQRRTLQWSLRHKAEPRLHSTNEYESTEPLVLDCEVRDSQLATQARKRNDTFPKSQPQLRQQLCLMIPQKGKSHGEHKRMESQPKVDSKAEWGLRHALVGTYFLATYSSAPVPVARQHERTQA